MSLLLHCSVFLFFLSSGDTALGYDLAKANMVHMDYEAHVTKGGSVPDVILVRKSYEEKRRKQKHRAARPWKLKHLDIEMGDERWVSSAGMLWWYWLLH